VDLIDLDYTARTVLAAPQVAAGASVTVPVPESESQLLVACRFRVATSAVVASRTPIVSVLGGDGISIVDAVSGFAITAGSTADFSFAAGLAEWDAAGSVFASGGLFAIPLAAGDSVQISLSSGDAGDQISRVRLTLLQTPIRPDDR